MKSEMKVNVSGDDEEHELGTLKRNLQMWARKRERSQKLLCGF